MSYQVLARKYRPQNFDEVVGQDHVTITLKNALKRNRLHHAYLFTGVRGTGKTSLARILAKSLNCEKGPTPNPCNCCSNCEAISNGQFLDVIEIDGASNTSVESVRELREQVKYLPAAGKYKVYIIDEVHMLSNSAFNALLKTLEEPPPHVVFVFATTEVHKVPLTILSRCQRFDLRRISQAEIQKRIQVICDKEGVGVDSASLDLLARSAEGSLRDAQSLLDMAIGLSGSELKVEPIREMLGLVETTWIEDLTQDCLQGKIKEGLAKVQEIYERGYDLRQVVMQWVQYFHDLILVKSAGPEALSSDWTEDKIKLMQEIVSSVELNDLQVAFQNLYRTSEQIFRSDSPKILFDLLIVKLIHGSPFQSLGALLSSDSKITPQFREKREIPSTPERVSETVSPQSISSEMLARALRKHPQIKAILGHAIGTEGQKDQLTVIFETGSMWVEMFEEKRGTFAELLQKELGKEVKILVREEKREWPAKEQTGEVAGNRFSEDPVVQQAINVLNATVKEVKRYGHD